MSVRLLVDGNGLACKLWWASASNVPQRFAKAVHAVHENADVTVCWDDPRGSWRKVVYPKYKSGRPPKPKALIESIRACSQMGFKDQWAKSFEADDVIATLVSRRCADLALVMSSDKDMAQLVTFGSPGRGPVLMISDGKVLDETAVRAKFGVAPREIRKLLSWTGDRVDGLPGVPGIGPKRAIEKVYANHGDGVGNRLTYDLTELSIIPTELILTGGPR